VTIPEGSIIAIIEPRSEKNGLLAVDWKGERVRMFAEDITLRARPVISSEPDHVLSESDHVLKELEEALSSAQSRREAASERFSDVIKQVPSGIPHPDGAARVHEVAEEYRDAQRQVSNAYRRMSDFLVNGTVPPDLAAAAQAGD